MSTKVFGLAQIKAEGTMTLFEPGTIIDMSKHEETEWLEEPFTARQFEHLADLLQSSSEFFARDLGDSCRRSAEYLRKYP